MAQLILTRAAGALARRAAPAAFRNAAVALARAGGAALGRRIDDRLFGEDRVLGPRLTDLHPMGSSEGVGVPLAYGRTRLGGEVIWAARIKERLEKAPKPDGAKGGAPKTQVYRYSMSFAVGLCEGVATRVDRIWANGVELDLSAFAWRLHGGTEDQAADPLIETIEGADQTPAYRGLAYVVFEDFPLDDGGRLPQLSFEVVRPAPGEPERLEALVRGVCLIPGAGEFAYADAPVMRAIGPGAETSENAHARADRADLLVSLDQLEAECPNLASVMLVVGWFGADLRAGSCRIKPGVESLDKTTRPLVWSVQGLSRAQAHVVSRRGGAPAYGGTPCDASVLAAIAEIKRRGWKVGLYPFLFMDVPPGSGLPDPYGGAEQAAYPWRGRIRPYPAQDKTAAVAGEIAAFFGAAGPQHCTAFGYSGPDEWSYRRFVLHYARLAEAAGGVDAFVIGSELRGLTTARDGPRSFPAVAALRALAADVRGIVGGSTKLTYAADWSEYSGHQPPDGSGDALNHLDPLWADPNIDMVGIDWYPPLTDWRDGEGHLDAAVAETDADRAYLDARVEGGEDFDWHYASPADRAAQTRSPITDGAHGKPWVFRRKDLRSWWANAHHDRPGGVEEAAATAWVPRSKPIWFVELGCPAIDKGANAPNLFIDPKSAESGLPPFSNGARDNLVQRRALEAVLTHWFGPEADNPISPIYGGPMLAADGAHLWAWDARPFPQFPARAEVWADAAAHARGHWLNGRLGAAPLDAVVVDLCRRAGVASVQADRLGGVVAGYVIDAPFTARAALEPLMETYGFDARAADEGLVFLPLGRGPAPVLDAAERLEPPEARRADPADRAGRVRLRYLDAARSYRVSTAEAAVRGGTPMSTVDRDAPFALDPDLAAAAAADLAQRIAADRESLTLSLPPDALAWQPGDRLRLEPSPDAPIWRIVHADDGAERRLTLRADPAPRFAGRGRPLQDAAVIAPPPRAALVVLDPPPLPGAEDDARPLVAVFARPWTEDHVVYAGPSGVRLSRRALAEAPAIVGTLAWDLWPGPEGRWDDGNVLRVRLWSDDVLESVTAGETLDGANAFAVETGDGWEILQAREATLVGPQEYALKGLLRGLQGTRPLPGVRALAGARVVKLDARLVRADVAAAEADATLLWTAAPLSAGAPSAEGAVPLAHRRLWARPFAPTHLRLVRAADGALEARWVRRARLQGDVWAPGEPPLGEEREAYRVEVLDGATILRTEETATPAWLYPEAAQIADFGAPVSTLRLRVAQISTTAGPGAVVESQLWV